MPSEYDPVSVPLRGKYRGEAIPFIPSEFKAAMFPSPYGVNIVAKSQKHEEQH
jgi:hypothetical protein